MGFKKKSGKWLQPGVQHHQAHPLAHPLPGSHMTKGGKARRVSLIWGFFNTEIPISKQVFDSHFSNLLVLLVL